MGPLSKVWHTLENFTTAPDHEADLTIEDLLHLVQQPVLLVGQTNNTMSYHRRLSTLAGTMKSSSQTKSMIKDKSALLENFGKELFGKDFRDQITDTVKAQKQSKELLFNVFQQQRTNKPFSKDPRKVSFIAGGQNISFKRRSNDSNSRRGFNRYSNAQFKNSGNQNSNLLQRNSTTNTTRRVVISTSVGKKIVLQFKDSSSTTGREISALPGQLGKTDKRSEYFADTQGISNSIPLQAKTKKGTKGNKLFNAREGNNLIRSGKSLEEGCCGTSLSTKRSISEQCIYNEKEG